VAAGAYQASSHDGVQDALFEAIDALPTKLRMTILLCGIQGYDTREVAALLQRCRRQNLPRSSRLRSSRS
jgi:DNA-directed RNA polymerase specialized sigma24 family protein